jgi:hypothetical protein
MESNGSNGGSPSTCIAESIGIGLHQSTMPKGVKRFSGYIMLYLFDLEPLISGGFDLKSSGSSRCGAARLDESAAGHRASAN